jgi:hypothetical protein
VVHRRDNFCRYQRFRANLFSDDTGPRRRIPLARFEGDADYFDFGNPRDNGCCEDIGLGIDDFDVNDMDTQPDWGPYDASHIYEVSWTGDGTTIAALFQDTYYGNNIGSLTLEILAFQ